MEILISISGGDSYHKQEMCECVCVCTSRMYIRATPSVTVLCEYCECVLCMCVYVHQGDTSTYLALCEYCGNIHS